MFIEHQVYFQGRFPCAWENYLIFRDTEFLECTTLFSNKAHSIKGALHSKFHPSLTGPPSYMSQSPIGRELSYSGPAKSSPKHDSKSHSGRSTAYHTIPPNVVFRDESFHQNSAHFRGDSILGGLKFQMTTILMNMLNMIIRMIILMKNLTLVIVNLVLNLQLQGVGKG